MFIRIFLAIYVVILGCFVTYSLAQSAKPANVNKSEKEKPQEEKPRKKKPALTFEDAVMAYKNNSGFQAEVSDRTKADLAYEQSTMMFLPDVRGYITSSRSKLENDRREMTLSQRSDHKQTDTRMGVKVTQNLFNGLSMLSNVDKSKFESEAAIHKLRIEEQKLILGIVDAYTAIWAGRKKVEAMKRKENNLKSFLLARENALDAGMSTSSEVAEASANHQKATYERIRTETELFTAESEFERLTGLKIDGDIELPDLRLDFPDSLDKFVQDALASNDNIIYARLLEQAAMKNLDMAHGSLSPSCDLGLIAERDLTSVSHDSHSARNNYGVSLEVSIPIFSNSANGGNSYSRIKIANQEALKAKFSTENTISQVRKECISTWNTYISTNAMIKASRSAVKSAELTSESNLEEIALGTKSNADILIKENTLLDSRVALVDSQRERIVAAMKLLSLTGNLTANSLLGRIRNRKVR
jgi:TolC family type I secretion outer membrane protein